jgi:hypothetical protein
MKAKFSQGDRVICKADPFDQGTIRRVAGIDRRDNFWYYVDWDVAGRAYAGLAEHQSFHTEQPKLKERRTLTRSHVDTIAPMRPCLEVHNIVATVQNMSIKGSGILTHQRLEPGAWFVQEPAETGRCLTKEGDMGAVRKHP